MQMYDFYYIHIFLEEYEVVLFLFLFSICILLYFPVYFGWKSFLRVKIIGLVHSVFWVSCSDGQDCIRIPHHHHYYCYNIHYSIFSNMSNHFTYRNLFAYTYTSKFFHFHFQYIETTPTILYIKKFNWIVVYLCEMWSWPVSATLVDALAFRYQDLSRQVLENTEWPNDQTDQPTDQLTNRQVDNSPIHKRAICKHIGLKYGLLTREENRKKTSSEIVYTCRIFCILLIRLDI